MKIAVDLDGTLYDWEATARFMLTAYRGCTGLEEKSQSWDYIQQRVSRQDWRWLWNDAKKHGLWRHGHVMKGGIKAVSDMKRMGHDLYIVTSRPQSAVRDTHRWVDFHFGDEHPYPWSEVRILGAGSKAEAVDAEVLIDDKIDNVLDWAAHNRVAVLFDQPWNRDTDSREFHRVVGWEEVVRCVSAM